MSAYYRHKPTGKIAVAVGVENNRRVFNIIGEAGKIQEWLIENSSDWKEMINEYPFEEGASQRIRILDLEKENRELSHKLELARIEIRTLTEINILLKHIDENTKRFT